MALNDVFDTLQVFMGGFYVNDFNRFGRTWQVNVQADAQFRVDAETVKLLKVRNIQGEMVPLGTVADIRDASGPVMINRYNMFPAAAINGAFVALVDALSSPPVREALGPIRFDEIVTSSIAAVSVGLLDGVELLDLEYCEDRDAEVDFNIVMTGGGQFVEVQGGGEEATFSREQLDRLISLGESGIRQVTAVQAAALGDCWAW